MSEIKSLIIGSSLEFAGPVETCRLHGLILTRITGLDSPLLALTRPSSNLKKTTPVNTSQTRNDSYKYKSAASGMKCNQVLLGQYSYGVSEIESSSQATLGRTHIATVNAATATTAGPTFTLGKRASVADPKVKYIH